MTPNWGETIHMKNCCKEGPGQAGEMGSLEPHKIRAKTLCSPSAGSELALTPPQALVLELDSFLCFTSFSDVLVITKLQIPRLIFEFTH